MKVVQFLKKIIILYKERHFSPLSKVLLLDLEKREKKYLKRFEQKFRGKLENLKRKKQQKKI